MSRPNQKVEIGRYTADISESVKKTVVSPTSAVEVSAEHPSPLIARTQNAIFVPARRGAVL